MPPENKTLQQKTKNGFEIADGRLRELEAVARHIEEQLLEMVGEAMQAFATLRTRQNEIICRIEEMEAQLAKRQPATQPALTLEIYELITVSIKCMNTEEEIADTVAWLDAQQQLEGEL